MTDNLSPGDETTHERSIRILGAAALETLAASHVLVAGLGGVGSYAVEALARSGVGTLSLVDYDYVTPSNLNRQLYALQSTLGCLKTAVATRRIADINPGCNVLSFELRITSDNVSELLSQKPDWVLDAIDDLPAKAALLATAHRMGIPSLAVLGTGNRSDPLANYTLADISATHTCPLARALRQRLRALGVESGIRTIFSPLPPQQQGTLGSTSYLPGQAGLIAAGVIIKALTASEA
ncbi:MAG: tRNA threonylcarbamoyladenosine dehydratase [Symbiobacteriaceae bacterium]|nr:tRNA threonylcarbamoyladenosine dehydratase [Symbiobacteriaceae bacterium]